jgi:hypothetical protein
MLPHTEHLPLYGIHSSGAMANIQRIVMYFAQGISLLMEQTVTQVTVSARTIHLLTSVRRNGRHCYVQAAVVQAVVAETDLRNDSGTQASDTNISKWNYCVKLRDHARYIYI